MVQSTQFGSYCDVAEYESDVHTLALNLDYQATEKLLLEAGLVYNQAEDSWEWNFEDRPQVAFTGATTTAGTEAVGYDSADINGLIDEYSDLSYGQYQLTLGGTYNFTDAMYMKASATYDIFNADEEFVYGDEEGDMISGYVGLGWVF